MRYTQQHIHHICTFALAGVLALTLVGCGGGGGDGGDGGDPPDPALQMLAAEAQAEATTAVAAASATSDLSGVADHKTNATNAAAQARDYADKAQMYAEAGDEGKTRAALAEATNQREHAEREQQNALDDIADAEGAATAAQAAAAGGKSYADMIPAGTAEKTAADGFLMLADAAATAAAAAAAMGDKDTAETEQGNAEKYRDMIKAELAKRTDIETDIETAAALTKRAAIEDEAGQGTDHGLGGAGAYTYAIAHKGGAVEVTITDPSSMAGDPEFMKTGDLPAAGGFNGSMHVRDMRDTAGDGVTEHAGVYTDIDAPTATPFTDVHALDVNPMTQGGTDWQSLNIVDANIAMATAGVFPGANVALTYVDDPNTPEDETVFEGMFDGAPGSFKCDGCTVSADGDGDRTVTQGRLWFTPNAADDANAPGTVGVADPDYLHFGFWVKKMEKDGKTTYEEVQTFAASSLGVFPGNALGSIEGTADYSGGAAGAYVMESFNPDGTVDKATSGTFAADAALTAKFGGDTVAVAEHFTISGEITGFVLSGGNTNGWSVDLDTASFSGGSTFTGAAVGESNDRNGAAAAWSGTFYGDADGTDAPGAVAGEFNANFPNGIVAGAFAGRKDD